MCRERRARKLRGHQETIGERFERDRAALLPLPNGEYEACERQVARVSSKLDSVPNIKRLPGERHRERVVTPEEEARYLAAGTEQLGAIATLLVDSGMRPEECYRLRWESINMDERTQRDVSGNAWQDGSRPKSAPNDSKG